MRDENPPASAAWRSEINRRIRARGGRKAFASLPGAPELSSLYSWLSPKGRLPSIERGGAALHDLLSTSDLDRSQLDDLLERALAENLQPDRPLASQGTSSFTWLLGTWYEVIGPEPVYWQGRQWDRRDRGNGPETTIDEVNVDLVEARSSNEGVRDIAHGTIRRLLPEDSNPSRFTFSGHVFHDFSWTLYLTFVESRVEPGGDDLDGVRMSRGTICLTRPINQEDFLGGLYVSRHLTSEARPYRRRRHFNGVAEGEFAPWQQAIVPRPIHWQRTRPGAISESAEDSASAN